MTLTRKQRAEIETALDGMAMKLAEQGQLREPLRSAYVRAIRNVRDLPAGFRRQRSDFGGCQTDPQLEIVQ